MPRSLLPYLFTFAVCLACVQEKKDAPSLTPISHHVSVHGKKIYYEEYGAGMPLLLLSGGGPNRSIKDFEKCIPVLALHFRVIAPDSRAQGKSDQPDTLTYEILTDATSVLIDSLKVDSMYVMG